PNPGDLSTPPSPAEPSPSTPPANSGSNFQPKARLRAVQAKFDSANASTTDWSAPHNSKTEATAVKTDPTATVVAKPIRLRSDADDYSRPVPTEQASATSSSGYSVGHAVATNGQVSAASGNPLRLQLAPSSSSEESPLPNGDNTRAGSAYSSDTNS